jgi:anthranilate synthase component 2
MLLMIDNYDSFTFNLVQYLQTLGAEVKVVRNDELSVAQIDALAPERIVLSPGPCTPNEAGVCVDVIRELGPRIPLLGVCLGHQAIGQHFGGHVVRGGLMHGKTSPVYHDGSGVFAGLPSPFTATRYHSLIVEDIPQNLVVNATSETPGLDGTSVMGFRHQTLPIHGVQFHPESIATEHGHALLANFLRLCGLEAKQAA